MQEASLSFIQKNKAVIRFLLTFFGSYILLALVYELYLSLGQSSVFYPEFITHIVALQSEQIIAFLGYDTLLSKSLASPAMLIGISGEIMVRVVEGCNAVSVIILFLSFILAFKKTWKQTLLYIFAGSVIIYTLNIIRIALITIGICHYPQHTEFMHGTLFPTFIYGVVFLLWVIWVRNFKKPETNE